MDNRFKFRVWNAKDGWYFSEEDCPTIKSDGKFDCQLGFYDELVVEQYTGLKDKNGVDIFEGDFVKVEFDANIIKLADVKELMGLGLRAERQRKHKIRLVEWKGLGFNPFSTVTNIGALGNETLEVVGNIHENPELIQ